MELFCRCFLIEIFIIVWYTMTAKNDNEMRTGQMSAKDMNSILWEMEHPEYSQVLDYIRENPSITIRELCEKMYYTDKKIKRILQKHKDDGVLTHVGSGRGGYWKVN